MVGYVTPYKIQKECYLLKSCLVDAGRMLLVMAEQVFLPMGDICCCLVTKSCLTLCNPMDCSTSGFPIFLLLLMSGIISSIRIFSNESPVRMKWPNIGASASASVFLPGKSHGQKSLADYVGLKESDMT